MEKTVSFTKMVGAGNDFIIVDNRSGILKGDLKGLARRLCDRKHAIGADGLLLLEKSRTADIRMRIFNPDGSEADMCGNGVRCLAKFAAEKKIKKGKLTVETPAGLIEALIRGNVVKAKITDPADLRLDLKIPLGGRMLDGNFIDTGVPHAVLVVDSVDKVDVYGTGRAIRCHKLFAPKGANVNFVSIAPGGIEVRTYERGVENETLSCGTGSTASALVAAALRGLESPVKVRTHGGEELKVYFSRNGRSFVDVSLEGPVQKSFEGRVNL
ncbi:MAG: diaminopimelate epimerase [Candidatus Omnitrophica bacterium]|nr:diaminopimelate epimerase [Candidatus Omnitrophota bacterium]